MIVISCFIWLLVGTIAIQAPNILSIQSQQGEGDFTLYAAVRIALLTLPITLFSTMAFTLFYGRGSEFFSYAAMSVYAKAITLLVAIIVQAWLLNSKDTNWLELIGLGLCVTGFVVSVYNKEILSRF